MQKDHQYISEIFDVVDEVAAPYTEIISSQALAEQLVGEWEACKDGSRELSHLKLMALRLCSRAICEAWHSNELERRERAFEVMGRYLRKKLLCTRYADVFQRNPHALNDILNHTLETLYFMREHDANAGPANPDAFFAWIHTILKRKLWAYLKKQQDAPLSLEEQFETLAEQWVDDRYDPIDYVLREELQQALKKAILSLRNPRYKQVLWYSFLAGMDEGELASRLHVPVGRIALWKHRALKMLRDNKEVMQALRSLAVG